ncbi:apolipoprotein N-acyltransferase [Legionella impletisoli]|uniref:Apolipoprotein N-acyltransferase n=1 Tax=Legionella impletisoli TaxID=343510 RepID=A0A917JPE9_9GAMM|nr:apolipoprotein N-acyltransferase [Legionella impletisoli]GGI76812.1 apolipoprotein N-acyltransferase [Legionella impletisoli]
MKPLGTAFSLSQPLMSINTFKIFLPALFAGVLLPFGFAPFHIPGLALLSIAFFFCMIQERSLKETLLIGYLFGIGSFGLGVSWVYVSIHQYGHLNIVASAAITLLFILYLSIYPLLMAGFYHYVSSACSSSVSRCVLFSALWCVSEYLRATVLGGFPWLLLGFSQLDTPLQYVLPWVGVYGVSFFACLAASFLGEAYIMKATKRYLLISAFTGTLILPAMLQYIPWGTPSSNAVTVGVIQANLSMRDKWDEGLFWQLIAQYKRAAEHLLKTTQLVVMPESAIPVPAPYISDFMEDLDSKATEVGSAILLGTLQPTETDDTKLYNAMIALGDGQGIYQKQHLVPFGEYIPAPFQAFIERMAIPVANLNPGKKNQPLVFIQNHPIASLICYELAYPSLLRKQLPLAEWIVSISDDGWFGHSFAMYQQLQMAQALSILTARYQIVANNDGLSSIIDERGHIIDSLPAYRDGLLESRILPIQGSTPWVYWGDLPILLICTLVVSYAFYIKRRRF